MSVVKNFLFCFLIMGTLSCQSLYVTPSKTSCSQLDWFEIGRADAVQGKPAIGWEKRQQQCLDFNDANHERYLTGWNGGIDDYCTREHGFVVGRSGLNYERVCPPSPEAEFLKGYELGQRIYTFEKDNLQISEELDRLNTALNKEKEEAKISGEELSRINQLETRMELNRAMISELQTEFGKNSRQ